MGVKCNDSPNLQVSHAYFHCNCDASLVKGNIHSGSSKLPCCGGKPHPSLVTSELLLNVSAGGLDKAFEDRDLGKDSVTK